MATSYAVRRTIRATPERVWQLLADGPGYPGWNPSVVSLDGTLAVGEKIRLVSAVAPTRTFSLTVAEMDGPRRMVWTDGMPLGLFKGVRTYTLEPVAGGTEFTMEEVFSGALAPLITKAIPDMTESFAQFADGLKTASESGD
jgi:uncharacterized protein YndB with AHSA1/START domain